MSYFYQNGDEEQYLRMLDRCLVHGDLVEGRHGEVYKLFGGQARFSLSDGFPAITTKKLYWKGVVEELLWFIRGGTNSKDLEERGVNIWQGNTSREFLDRYGFNHYPEGQAGPIYGHQWRNWGGQLYPDSPYHGTAGTDQLQNVVDSLKENPHGRRHVVSAWNVQQLPEMALPPCHMFMQFYVNGRDELSCQMYQRSVDMFLGAPFNIASYSLLTHIMAHLTGYHLGEFIWTLGDYHVCREHVDAVETQLDRNPYPKPALLIDADFETLDDVANLDSGAFRLHNYQHHPAIKAEMKTG